MKKPSNISAYLVPNRYVTSNLPKHSKTVISNHPNQTSYDNYFDRTDSFQQIQNAAQKELSKNDKNNNKTQKIISEKNVKEQQISLKTPKNHQKYTVRENQIHRISHSKPIKKKADTQLGRQLEDLLSQLKSVKKHLQLQIVSLQSLLDQTSKYLGNLEEQFLKIKFQILQYTSRSLDGAFRNYKKNMARWSKYQQMQKKGMQVAKQAQAYLQEQHKIYQNLQKGIIDSNLQANNRQLTSRINHYQFTAQQLNKVKIQCENKHPKLREQKIEQFENCLFELCVF